MEDRLDIKETDKQIKEMYDKLQKELDGLKGKAKAEKKKIDEAVKEEKQNLKKRISRLRTYLIGTGQIKPRKK